MENISNNSDLIYESDFRKCERVEAPLTRIRQYLGEFDADKEWNRNNEDAYKRFLTIGAYKQFIEEESLLLIGRTGTGKTAILNCYMYDVMNNKIPTSNIKNVIKLDFKQYIMQLAKYGEINSATYVQNEIENNIEMIINLAVMQDIVKKQKQKGNNNYEIISKYVDSQNLNSTVNLLDQSINEIGNIFADNMAGKLITSVGVLGKFAQKYKTPDYENAINALHRYLENNDFLVLVDSMDTYDIRELSVVLVVKALIETCFRYYNNNSACHIQLKVALPAEIYAHIVTSLPEKHQSNTIAIEWKYRDLVKMIALRVLYFSKKEKKSVFCEISDKYSYEDFYDDYEKAKAYLTFFLPTDCPANISLSFDTIAYCIRHTQKKPRQLMKIFNMFIEIITRKQDLQYFYTHKDTISNYIHMVQEDMIKDALSMYNAYTNNKIIDICEIVLSNRKMILGNKELKECIRSASSIYRKDDNYLDEKDILRILVESGLLGKYKRHDLIKANSHMFQNSNTIKIITTLFEYQIKGQLYFAPDDQYIIHPMCYEYFTNEIDYNALIYPAPVDDEDDIIVSILQNSKDRW